MVGSPRLPKLVLVLVQADPFVNELPEIKSVFGVVIENLVCKCDITPCLRTDHKIISLEIKFDKFKRGPGHWKFNCIRYIY